ncbi:MAG: tripartite tricarboxylate transporter substrate binding protein [Comamonadaceae bacterium]|nr:tripartite tricarboxylate transporter substrate binding protein [Comamonadaceae bacterium]
MNRVSTHFSAVRRALVLAAFALGASASASASDYPSRTVKIVVPFSAGSATDIFARKIAEKLGQRLNGSFVVENMGGASGQIAAEHVARSKPDGYTLFNTTNSTQSANPALFKKLRYDPSNDFEPITLTNETPFLLVIRSDLPVKSVPELVAWLNENPSKVSYGYGNSSGQISGASFARAAGLKTAVSVPYKGTPQALTDVIGGNLSFMFVDLGASMSFLAPGGTLKALAVTSPKRTAARPDLPTMNEAMGRADQDLVAWGGFFAPAGTPKGVVALLNKEIRAIVNLPEFVEYRKSVGGDVMTNSPEEFARYVEQSIQTWGTKIREAGIAKQ